MGETWIKLNCLFCEFNVDGFWAQLGVFFYFRYFQSKSQKSGRVCVISMTQLSFFTLPAQPQGTVSYSFLLSLPCRRSRRVLYLTRFFFLSYPAGAAAGYCILLVSSFFIQAHAMRLYSVSLKFFLLSTPGCQPCYLMYLQSA